MNKSNLTLVCYHYVKRHDEFSRIWGHDFELFKKHTDFFLREWKPIGVNDLSSALSGDLALPSKCSILTFDDGLKEHVTIFAPYLRELGISAVFNVCTNTVMKREPTIAQTIHFGTAYFGIRAFADIITKYIADSGMKEEYFKIREEAGNKNILELNTAVKRFFNKGGRQKMSHEITNDFWHKELERIFPDIFDRVFMNEEDIKKLVSMGHTVGLHTASHSHIKDEYFTQEFIRTEIVDAKKNLESIVDVPVDCFAYPFGYKEETLNKEENIRRLSRAGFDYIFTTYFDGDKRFKKESLGRYLSQSQDTVHVLQSRLWSYEIGDNNKQSSAP